MAASDLVTLSSVKSWLQLTNSDATRDALLSSLITQISLAVYNYTGRLFFLPRTTTDLYSGNERDRLQLRYWPVNSITNLVISGQTIPASSGYTSGGALGDGYILEAPDLDPPGNMQLLHLSGYYFKKGVQNVSVTYSAGYQILAETQIVPSSGPYTVNVSGTYGPWGSDLGVVYTTGGASLTSVVTPTVAGQYSVSSGLYTFSAADAGASVNISYGYVPADLSQAVLMWIADVYARMDRVGIASKSIGGAETVSYLNEDMPKFVKLSLQNFCRVITN